MRKLIAAVLAVILMVMVAAPAAQAGDATAQVALGLAAFAVFSQFVMPLLAGPPAYAPAPVPAPIYLPPLPVVERDYVDPRYAPHPWYGSEPGHAPRPGYRPYGYAPQRPPGPFADQGRPWAWSHRDRLAPRPPVQAE